MIWEGKRLRDVTEGDLRKVLESGIEEHKQLDYKAELYSNNDAGQKDFLVDVCGFANADGGILLIGVPELRNAETSQPTGVPDAKSLEGIESSNPELLLLSYDARVESRIEERLHLESHAIKLENGKYVFAIRVPNSLNKPHCVRHDNKRYFPSRRDRHIYYMDVQEIKELVMRTASRQEQAEQLLKDACREVLCVADAPYLIFASVPIFWKEFLVDLRNGKIISQMQKFSLLPGQTYENVEFSFQGLERLEKRQDAVAQLRRNGLVRYSLHIPAKKVDGFSQFSPTAIDLYLRSYLRQVIGLYEAAGITGPYLLCMMMALRSEAQGLFPDSMLPGVDVVRGSIQPGLRAFPIMVADDFTDMDSLMRPLCDQAHQAFGEPKSPNFNHEGKWIGK